uniref:Secreted protein n=1 Tax=Ascaris lumbricoides TaxID=6252 RepID=A0A0M3ICJ0_ASCLU
RILHHQLTFTEELRRNKRGLRCANSPSCLAASTMNKNCNIFVKKCRNNIFSPASVTIVFPRPTTYLRLFITSGSLNRRCAMNITIAGLKASFTGMSISVPKMVSNPSRSQNGWKSSNSFSSFV